MKKVYKSPTIEVFEVELEESIAAASIVTGGSTSRPQIEEENVIERTEYWTVDLD
ncbi:hypothetical protein [Sphingobacterium paucimobilis]|uniref:Uncharacterized protein n=1 Tax=Sphingobacterium paucimobilis HER1398 TaxID=1346330 RepID=U2J319_9SPHI|nr:hypothetical protein [Sphingobacterium paucimobilis]ERJ59359.1 hypothetical protein M472_11300 [Sphingobacterium paucimobilis HER1398]